MVPKSPSSVKPVQLKSRDNKTLIKRSQCFSCYQVHYYNLPYDRKKKKNHRPFFSSPNNRDNINLPKRSTTTTHTWWTCICGGQRAGRRGNLRYQAWGRSHSRCRPCSRRRTKFAWNQTYLIVHSNNTSSSHRWTSQLIHHKEKTYGKWKHKPTYQKIQNIILLLKRKSK